MTRAALASVIAALALPAHAAAAPTAPCPGTPGGGLTAVGDGLAVVRSSDGGVHWAPGVLR